jgi:hypothetical protein
MPVVRAFQIAGLDLWFWSNDHEPPHFHAKKRGKWEVRIYFLLDPSQMDEVVWKNAAIRTKELRQWTVLSEQHRVELLEPWEEIHPQ